MRLHYFQHVPFEDPGYISRWAEAKKIPVSATHFHMDWPEPDLAEIDVLVVMGGPMGVYDEKQYPWLALEKRYIEKAIDLGKRVLGICLGAQLIACVLGARVYKNRHKEIGWFQVGKVDTANSALWRHTPERGFFAFHWHGDTFNLPGKAVHLAYSGACRHQAFVYEERVLGLQFHLESTLVGIKNLIQNCRAELKQGEFIQPEKRILEDSRKYLSASHRVMAAILDRITASGQ